MGEGIVQREARSEIGRKQKINEISWIEKITRLPLTSGFKLLTSRTEFPAPVRPGIPSRPAAAAAAAADGIVKGASAPCTFGTERPEKIKKY